MINNQFSPWPSFTQEEADAVQSVLLSNKVNYWTGNECREFEKEFAAWSDAKYAVALGNGTLALDVAFKALDISIGDEVIVTSRTFVASIFSIVNSGLVPIFADVDLDTQNITAESVRSVITNKTKAIVCVHLAGWPCEMDAIMQIASEFNLYVIEDCSQAHGAKYKGTSVGSIGHIGCWSFCQDKIMTTGGEGGIVTTNDESFWRKMWAYKDHGKSYEAVYEREHPEGFKWLHESFGSNWRMTEMQAAIGRIQLKRMSDWHTKRLINANKIWNNTKKCKGLRTPSIPDYIEHAAYKCYVFIELKELKNGWSRDKIITEISALSVPCYSGSCSEVYLEKAFSDTAFRPKERLINAKELGETSLVFLVHPTLAKDEIQQTLDAISSVMSLATK
ncbi:DegT/DnrJ/EryC1/StrS aminotransferase family protein [Candidatus Pseudothioglobus sp. Uisw_041]|jgi:dTDP-4-amino-4,6-dideoxygalactose transaminase|uniref:DegT/DnrJ/EryC1/StrS family aminotransferase n=1 Tax=Candidatus Pseudothioglobus sp. Uisw_041 TaxID=3230996 RepID=UPI003A8579D9